MAARGARAGQSTHPRDKKGNSKMNRSGRLWGYGVIVLALLSLLAVSPSAWATPAQSRPGQGMTVPTRTPVVDWSPTPRPTDRPQATDVPPTDVPPTDVPRTSPTPATPGAPLATQTPAPSATAGQAAGGALALAVEVGRLETWPGRTVTYTVTLRNTGSASLRQVLLEDILPDGLEPGAVQGTDAAWDGRALRGRLPLLPPGGRLVVVFNAAVRAGASGGGLLVNRAQAAADGGLTASAEAVVALPPDELPVVGGALDRLRVPALGPCG